MVNSITHVHVGLNIRMNTNKLNTKPDKKKNGMNNILMKKEKRTHNTGGDGCVVFNSSAQIEPDRFAFRTNGVHRSLVNNRIEHKNGPNAR